MKERVMNFTVLFSLLITCVMSVSALASTTHVVQMKSVSYEPKLIEIKVGDAVTWKNVSYTEHSATADDSTPLDMKFESGLIQPKKTTKPFIFKKAGTIMYHCSVHGKTMSAKVVVKP